MKKSVFEQKVTYKSLAFMLQGSDSRFLDAALESGDDENLKKHFKNVCASLSVELVQRLEGTIGMLGMSKREFIEIALIEALDKVDLILEETGVNDFIDDLSSKQAA